MIVFIGKGWGVNVLNVLLQCPNFLNEIDSLGQEMETLNFPSPKINLMFMKQEINLGFS